VLAVVDAENSYMVSGNGDLISADDGIIAIGSGGNYALAAAKSLIRHSSLSASEIVSESLKIASEICIYTNDRITVEELHPAKS
jgi:ATP-dependent HslUV protease subunit HslV